MPKQRIRSFFSTMTIPSFWFVILIASSFLFRITISADQQCISNINDIYDTEKDITDTSTERTYVLCPNRRYKIGSLDFYSQNLRGGDKDKQQPIPLRPNMKIQCGDVDSSRSCFIESGDLQVDGTAMRGLRDDNLDNVEIVGFIFEGAMKNSFWTTKPGSITFRNCEWTMINDSSGPIILDYFDSFAKNKMLIVSFEDCRFHDNQYSGVGAQTALVVGNSEQNKLIFKRTVFDNNNMQNNNLSPESQTHLIESLGSVTIQDSCFVNNQVAAANVAVYDNELLVSEIVHANDMGGSICQFASVFKNYQQYRSLKPSCVTIDSSKVLCDHLPSGRTPTPIKPVNQYVPFTINALQYDSAFENEYSILEGGCNREGTRPVNELDAQNNEDSVCLSSGGCHISHSSSGEYLVYRFAHDEYLVGSNDEVYVDVTVRVSSARRKEFRLELLYDGQIEESKSLYSEGRGYKEYTTIAWRNVPLQTAESIHSIRFWFVQGSVNFCAINVEYSDQKMPVPAPLPPLASPTSSPLSITRNPSSTAVTNNQKPPITWAALDYDTAYEITPESSIGGCNLGDDGVDAQLTTDTTCLLRDESKCNIGWWDAGEFFIYHFSIPQDGKGQYNIRVRVSSKRSGNDIGIDLITGDNDKDKDNDNDNDSIIWDSMSFIVPAQGYQNFNDVVWESVFLEPNDYSLKVKSTAGSINLCSVAIFESDTTNNIDPNPDDNGGDNDYNVVVPGIYSAMYYSDNDSFDTTMDHLGNCPFRKDTTSIDAKINNDSICRQSITENGQHCNVAFTESNEYLFYDFKKEANQKSIKVFIRVASNRERDISVELYSSDMVVLLGSKVVRTPGNNSWEIYDNLVVWDKIDIGNEEVFKMKITFLEGQVNLCSFGIE